MRRSWVKPFIAFSMMFALIGQSSNARAQGFGDISLIDPNIFSNLVPKAVIDSLIKTTGVYASHRAYQGATSIYNYNSLDVYVEATLMKVGSALPDALAANGLNTSSVTNTPGVPTAKIHIRKAFNQYFDLGVSGINYRGQSIYGGDAKIVLYDPEEGPSFGLRLGYTYMDVPVLYTKSHVFNPELVVSRKLYFAEPYLGAGYRYITGKISIPINILGTIKNYNASGTASDQYVFTGIFFRIFGPQGLRLGIEGTFDFGGFSSLGMVFGFGF